MKETENNNNQNQGGNGFVWGMALGASLVFLLGTKQGRRILRMLSEKGLNMLENMTEQNGYDLPFREEEMENDAMEESLKTTTKSASPHSNGHSPSVKRIFRGIKRK